MKYVWMQTLPLAVLLSSACHMAPPFEPPQIDVPADFKVSGPWKAAAPADAAAKGEWWKIFGDAELNRLQSQLANESPTLEAALQRVEQARARVDEERAGLFPQIGVGTTVTQNRTSSNSPGFRPGQTLTFWRAPITFQYEVDLWGQVRGGIAASRAELASREALAENTRLLLQAELAAQYLQLRALDAERGLLEEAVKLRRRTLQLVETRFAAGDVAELDVAQARTELAEAETDSIALERRRAVRENAVAALCGQLASHVRVARKPLHGTPPQVSKALPSSLLERRPDVASRERLMAAANERAGIARTAYFPQVGINLGGGFESAKVEKLFDGDSFLSSIGGGVQQVVFDGGLRGARHRRALAERAEAAANYKETVVTAFREVEDALAAIQLLEKQHTIQQRAVESARRMLELSEKQYEAGFVSYFEVVIAQRALLRAQQSAAQLLGARFEAAVLLVRALGGGW